MKLVNSLIAYTATWSTLEGLALASKAGIPVQEAVAVLEARGFTEQDFALSHPGGNLGRRLLLHVSDIMHTGERIPLVTSASTLKETLLGMSFLKYFRLTQDGNELVIEGGA